MTPDIINAIFNIGGAVAVSTSVFKLYRDKIVRGIHWPMMIFFISWSSWNLYFYAYLSQWFSVLGGLSIVAAEAIYIGLLIYYSRLEDHYGDAYSEYLEELAKNGNKNGTFDPHAAETKIIHFPKNK